MSTLSFLFASVVMLTNAVDVTSAVHKSAKGAHFELRGKAFPYVPDHACFLLTDATGSTRAELRGCDDPERLQCGDIVHVSGMIAPDPSGIGIAICSQLVVEAHGNRPPQTSSQSIAILHEHCSLT